jgi:hypothetical protein
MPRLRCLAAAAPLAILVSGCSADTEYLPVRASEEIQRWELGGTEVTVEIADSREERQQGLMFRRAMPPDHGMLFVWPAPQVMHFWMKNTPLPLSIAFIEESADGKSGTIVNVEDMQPFTERPGAVSHRPVRLALEMNQGWFAAKGLKNGSTVALPDWVGAIVPSGDADGGGP